MGNSLPYAIIGEWNDFDWIISCKMLLEKKITSQDASKLFEATKKPTYEISFNETHFSLASLVGVLKGSVASVTRGLKTNFGYFRFISLSLSLSMAV